MLSASFSGALGTLVGLVGVLFAAILLMAFVLLRDALFSGMGVGKKMMRLRVVRSDGSRCTFEASALRNVTMLVPLVNLLELAIAVFDVHGRRLGDKIARTQVLE